ncbi:Putative Mn2+ efflux pump MntP [Parelusimicrobium proximum]|uniref:manganese efflux pump MntP n=1 Tax=Parelusimicrobium proximum TaxID=3228953 RepID=UPI003D1633E7
MSIFSILLLSVGLSLDNFAASLANGCSAKNLKGSHIFSAASSFTVAHFIMFTLGWVLGAQILQLIHAYDHWVSFFILLAVGIKNIKEGFKNPAQDNAECKLFTGGFKLLMIIAVATSLDALAVGLSLSVTNASFTVLVISICVCVFLTSAIGFKLGEKLGSRFGNRMTIAGGLILIAIGIKILLEGLK